MSILDMDLSALVVPAMEFGSVQRDEEFLVGAPPLPSKSAAASSAFGTVPEPVSPTSVLSGKRKDSIADLFFRAQSMKVLEEKDTKIAQLQLKVRKWERNSWKAAVSLLQEFVGHCGTNLELLKLRQFDLLGVSVGPEERQEIQKLATSFATGNGASEQETAEETQASTKTREATEKFRRELDALFRAFVEEFTMRWVSSRNVLTTLASGKEVDYKALYLGKVAELEKINRGCLEIKRSWEQTLSRMNELEGSQVSMEKHTAEYHRQFYNELLGMKEQLYDAQVKLSQLTKVNFVVPSAQFLDLKEFPAFSAMGCAANVSREEELETLRDQLNLQKEEARVAAAQAQERTQYIRSLEEEHRALQAELEWFYRVHANASFSISQEPSQTTSAGLAREPSTSKDDLESEGSLSESGHKVSVFAPWAKVRSELDGKELDWRANLALNLSGVRTGDSSVPRSAAEMSSRSSVASPTLSPSNRAGNPKLAHRKQVSVSATMSYAALTASRSTPSSKPSASLGADADKTKTGAPSEGNSDKDTGTREYVLKRSDTGLSIASVAAPRRPSQVPSVRSSFERAPADPPAEPVPSVSSAPIEQPTSALEHPAVDLSEPIVSSTVPPRTLAKPAPAPKKGILRQKSKQPAKSGDSGVVKARVVVQEPPRVSDSEPKSSASSSEEHMLRAKLVQASAKIAQLEQELAQLRKALPFSNPHKRVKTTDVIANRTLKQMVPEKKHGPEGSSKMEPHKSGAEFKRHESLESEASDQLQQEYSSSSLPDSIRRDSLSDPPQVQVSEVESEGQEIKGMVDREPKQRKYKSDVGTVTTPKKRGARELPGTREERYLMQIEDLQTELFALRSQFDVKIDQVGTRAGEKIMAIENARDKLLIDYCNLLSSSAVGEEKRAELLRLLRKATHPAPTVSQDVQTELPGMVAASPVIDSTAQMQVEELKLQVQRLGAELRAQKERFALQLEDARSAYARLHEVHFALNDNQRQAHFLVVDLKQQIKDLTDRLSFLNVQKRQWIAEYKQLTAYIDQLVKYAEKYVTKGLAPRMPAMPPCLSQSKLTNASGVSFSLRKKLGLLSAVAVMTEDKATQTFIKFVPRSLYTKGTSSLHDVSSTQDEEAMNSKSGLSYRAEEESEETAQNPVNQSTSILAEGQPTDMQPEEKDVLTSPVRMDETGGSGYVSAEINAEGWSRWNERAGGRSLPIERRAHIEQVLAMNFPEFAYGFEYFDVFERFAQLQIELSGLLSLEHKISGGSDPFAEAEPTTPGSLAKDRRLLLQKFKVFRGIEMFASMLLVDMRKKKDCILLAREDRLECVLSAINQLSTTHPQEAELLLRQCGLPNPDDENEGLGRSCVASPRRPTSAPPTRKLVPMENKSGGEARGTGDRPPPRSIEGGHYTRVPARTRALLVQGARPLSGSRLPAARRSVVALATQEASSGDELSQAL